MQSLFVEVRRHLDACRDHGFRVEAVEVVPDDETCVECLTGHAKTGSLGEDAAKMQLQFVIHKQEAEIQAKFTDVQIDRLSTRPIQYDQRDSCFVDLETVIRLIQFALVAKFQ